MLNENAAMQELAENLWQMYFKGKVRDGQRDVVRFYRAQVVANNGDGTLNVQEPFDNVHTILAVPAAAGLAAGDECVVAMLGDATNSIVIGSGTLQDGDPVIERGVSGVWTYEKYASGKCIAQGSFARTNVALTTAYGSLYGAASTMYDTLPTGIFTAIEQDMITANGGAMLYCGLSPSVANGRTSTYNFIYWQSVSSLSMTVRHYLVGAWK